MTSLIKGRRIWIVSLACLLVCSLAGCTARCRDGTDLVGGKCVARTTEDGGARDLGEHPLANGSEEAPAPAGAGTQSQSTLTAGASGAAGAVASSVTENSAVGTAGSTGDQAKSRESSGTEPEIPPTAGSAAQEMTASTACGNGVIEGDEICDGDCPVECDSDVSCVTSALTGSAATCDAQCASEPISKCVDDDGCCPQGCTFAVDSDCSPSCGDGVLSSNEKCEPGSSEKPCPTAADCDDRDPCTQDMLLGSAEQCSAECVHAPIISPRNNDGCCPERANAGNDADCETVCGDGATTGAETCDGNCRTSCAPARGCLQEKLRGSPSTCDVTCTAEIVTARIPNDSCCPPGALKRDDNDCTAECVSLADCGGQPGECEQKACRAGACVVEPAASGTPCRVGSCDGNGECVAPPPTTGDFARCSSDSECSSSNYTCVIHRDSGGHCTPKCNTSGDCVLSNGGRGLCVSGGACLARCVDNADCPSGITCEAYDKNGAYLVCDVTGYLHQGNIRSQSTQ